jgi:hypothetical protein
MIDTDKAPADTVLMRVWSRFEQQGKKGPSDNLTASFGTISAVFIR